MLLYKQKLYLSQVKYYNVNPIHGHLTRKICREKGHIATDRKYKDPNCYKKKLPKEITDALPMPTSMRILINISHKASMKKTNNPEFKIKNKVK